MIISRTPFRVSFAGGLSDIPTYYKKHGGYVISTTIDKYVYITVNDRFDGKYKITYLKGEESDSIDDIKHPIFRECLKYVGIDKPIEVVSIADIPGGSGLGSSSAFTVGLLNALYRYKGINVNKKKLAEDACNIEINILGEPIGKQDQYAAAFGGLNKYTFEPNYVQVEPINMDNNMYEFLQKNLLLFYTGTTRKSKDVLHNHNNDDSKEKHVNDLTHVALDIYNSLVNGMVNGNLVCIF